MTAKDGKAMFGAAPPDLSVIARSRGADWLYTYLRSFYRDPNSPTGWNNAVFPNVGMPHALWTLQGERSHEAGAVTRDGKPVMEHGHRVTEARFEMSVRARRTRCSTTRTVRDLVNFLTWVGEPVPAPQAQSASWCCLPSAC